MNKCLIRLRARAGRAKFDIGNLIFKRAGNAIDSKFGKVAFGGKSYPRLLLLALPGR